MPEVPEYSWLKWMKSWLRWHFSHKPSLPPTAVDLVSTTSDRRPPHLPPTHTGRMSAHERVTDFVSPVRAEFPHSTMGG